MIYKNIAMTWPSMAKLDPVSTEWFIIHFHILLFLDKYRPHNPNNPLDNKGGLHTLEN